MLAVVSRSSSSALGAADADAAGIDAKLVRVFCGPHEPGVDVLERPGKRCLRGKPVIDSYYDDAECAPA
jgi:hypothetical protein